MKAGFARVCIDPPYGAPICGYYEARFNKGIHDSLYVRATVFDDGDKKAAVIALDLGVLGTEYFEAMKNAVHEASGIDRDAIFINLSHTHTGPSIGKDFAAEGGTSTPEYDATLIASVRDAVMYAVNDLCEVRVETASAQARNISFVRRYRMKDGSVATNPGVNNPNIDRALGVPDETVKLVKLIRDGADDIFIVNFGTHPDSVGGEYISADYIGYVCSIIETAVPGTKCMFLQAPQGDVNHVNVHPTSGESAITTIGFDGVPRGIKHAEHMGRVIAGAVLSVCSVTEPLKTDRIKFASAEVHLPSHKENDRLDEARKIYELYSSGRADELPYKEMELTTVVAEARRIIMLENGPEAYKFVMSAIGIGDLVFAGIGGEPFTEIGVRICTDSPFDTTVLCALTNCSAGYIPTTKAYSEGGYEARSSSLKPGGDDIIVDGMTRLLKSIK